MAIDEYPDVRCTHPRHRELPPAVGFIRDTWTDIKSIWRPRCEEHIAELADDPDHDLVDVAYLDPTRQRRPDPDRAPRDHSYDPNDPLYFTADPAT